MLETGENETVYTYNCAILTQERSIFLKKK